MLRRDLDQLAAEVQPLRRADTYRTLKELTDWDAYFAEQRLHPRRRRFPARRGTGPDAAGHGPGGPEQGRAHPLQSLPAGRTRNSWCRVCPVMPPSGFELLRRYPQHWDWQALSANHTLPWSAALLARLTDHWDWSVLSANPSLPWTPELIQRFATVGLGRPLRQRRTPLESGADRTPCGPLATDGTRHLAALWQRLHRQDIVELMDSAPEPLEEDADEASEAWR